jgi:hypothetical protein
MSSPRSVIPRTVSSRWRRRRGINAKWLLERDGKIKVTVPSLIETNTDDLAQALAAA